MEPFYHSLPSKRSFSNSETSTINGFSERSRKLPPPPLTAPPGHVGFRILCNVSLISAFIGKYGMAIKKLQQDTVAKIQVEDAPHDCDDRVIVVVASSATKHTVTLNNPKASGYDHNAVSVDVLEVSDAQIALVRVFDRILDVAMVAHGVSVLPGGVVSCRLLAESRQVGSVIGKDGKIIEKIRMECCCRIKILGEEKRPVCAGTNNEIIEIEGDIMAVRQALLAVSQCLQDCPTDGMLNLIESGSLDTIPQDAFPDFHVSLPKQSFSVQGNRSRSFKGDSIFIMDSETLQKEVIFKILCSNDKVGGVIGNGGAIIAAFQKETGASISIGPLVAESDERLITITASQNPESRSWPAQYALCLVFAQSIEAGFVKGLEPQLNEALTVSARLVASSNKVGCLLGKGGAVIAELRRETGTHIMIIENEQVPKCVSENDVVIQISGGFVNVQDAICHVTSRLHERTLSTTASSVAAGVQNNLSALTDVRQYGRTGDDGLPGAPTPYSVSHNLNPYPSLTPYVEVGNRSAVVTNTSVEIVVSRDLIGSIYGENGANLNRMRKISGAKVIVHEDVAGGSDDVLVSISGSPDETQAAQSLLQAFILIRS